MSSFVTRLEGTALPVPFISNAIVSSQKSKLRIILLIIR
jgi:hypothetical protein